METAPPAARSALQSNTREPLAATSREETCPARSAKSAAHVRSPEKEKRTRSAGGTFHQTDAETAGNPPLRRARFVRALTAHPLRARLGPSHHRGRGERSARTHDHEGDAHPRHQSAPRGGEHAETCRPRGETEERHARGWRPPRPRTDPRDTPSRKQRLPPHRANGPRGPAMCPQRERRPPRPRTDPRGTPSGKRRRPPHRGHGPRGPAICPPQE